MKCAERSTRSEQRSDGARRVKEKENESRSIWRDACFSTVKWVSVPLVLPDRSRGRRGRGGG